MITRDIFLEIKRYEEMKLKINQVATKLELSHPTVSKYWRMSVEDFDAARAERMARRGTAPKAAVYDGLIIKLLGEFPGRTSAQIIDLIKEETGQDTLEVCDRSIQTRVGYIRREFFPEECKRARGFEARDPTEPGEEMQCDFGVMSLRAEGGGQVKVHFIVCLLSYSRYKFVKCQDHPFRSAEVVNSLQEAFGFFGGMPRLMMIDQDCTMVVRENAGDIEYTKVFQRYIDAVGLEMYVCRARDPQTKGKVENVVKYFKQNFLSGRAYPGVDELNSQALAWLRRTGNGKVHATTKKRPAEEWARVERTRLLPTQEYEHLEPETIIIRKVRKDNTINYLSNLYRVPYGTYKGEGQRVSVWVKGSKLTILDYETGEHIFTHTIVAGDGRIVDVPEELRRQRKNFRDEEAEVLEFFGDSPTACAFVSAIRQDKPRYVGDQLRVILRCLPKWEGRKLEALDAMDWLLAAGEPSANALAARMGGGPEEEPRGLDGPAAEKRPLSAYAEVAGPGKGAENV